MRNRLLKKSMRLKSHQHCTCSPHNSISTEKGGGVEESEGGGEVKKKKDDQVSMVTPSLVRPDSQCLKCMTFNPTDETRH